MPKIQSSIGARPLRRVMSRGAIAVVASLGFLALPTIADASDWPKFQKGVWQFERTLAANGNGGIIFKTRDDALRRPFGVHEGNVPVQQRGGLSLVAA